jgi:superfamily II DNA or RNA helicase
MSIERDIISDLSGLLKRAEYRLEDQTFTDSDGSYNVAALYELAKAKGKPQNLKIDDLLHNLEPSPEEEGEELPGHPDFVTRAEAAGTLPGVVVDYPDGRWVADGVHRLWQARQDKKKKYPAYVLNKSDLASLLSKQDRPLDALLAAKKESDRRNYPAKHAILRKLIKQSPGDFMIDSEEGNIYGVTHIPTGFRIHMPRSEAPSGLQKRPTQDAMLAAGTKQAAVKADVQLQPHQQRVLEDAGVDTRKLLYHTLGSGKTLSAIAAAEELRKPYGVVVPAALRPNFGKELDKFTDRKLTPDVKSYTALATDKPPEHSSTVIFDEAHRLRNAKSKRARNAKELAAKAQQVYLLSGSPIVNAPNDMAPLMEILTRQDMTPGEFDKQFLGTRRTKPSFWQSLQGMKPGVEYRLKNQRELEKQLKGKVDYHQPDAPAVERIDEDILVDMGPEQVAANQRFYQGLPKSVRRKLDSNFPMSKSENKNLMAFLNGPRQVALSTHPWLSDEDKETVGLSQTPKLQRAMEEMESEIEKDPNSRTIVFSNFIEAGLKPYAAALAEKNIPHGVFHGGLTDKQRADLVNKYNAGELRALLLGPAASEGISLSGTKLIQLLDPHWNEARLEQAVGRGIRYDSHDHLPEEERKVRVQRYISQLPKKRRSVLSMLSAQSRDTADKHVQNLAGRKQKLNNEFLAKLREIGTPAPQKQASTSPVMPPADVYIIRGNPDVDTGHAAEYEAFYDAIKKNVEARGLTAEFDPGLAYTSPPGGKYWIGHSRGVSRLDYAPENVQTLALDDYEPADTRRVQAARYQKLFKELGHTNIADIPVDQRPQPGPEHYTFNDDMRAALNKMFLSKQAKVTHIGGPSGSGKTTVLEEIREKYPELALMDLDELDYLANNALKEEGETPWTWGERHQLGKDWSDENRLKWKTKKQQGLDQFIEDNNNKDKDVVLAGTLTNVELPGDMDKIRLNTGALRSAWRGHRRDNRGDQAGRRRRLVEFPSHYREARSTIKNLESFGYTPQSQAEIIESFGKKAGIPLPPTGNKTLRMLTANTPVEPYAQNFSSVGEYVDELPSALVTRPSEGPLWKGDIGSTVESVLKRPLARREETTRHARSLRTIQAAIAKRNAISARNSTQAAASQSQQPTTVDSPWGKQTAHTTPTPQVQAPGASWDGRSGWFYDVIGRNPEAFELSSSTGSESTWTYKPTGMQYTVPDAPAPANS